MGWFIVSLPRTMYYFLLYFGRCTLYVDIIHVPLLPPVSDVSTGLGFLCSVHLYLYLPTHLLALDFCFLYTNTTDTANEKYST